MVDYHGQKYHIYESHYNGTPDGYFCNGNDYTEAPTNKSYRGYIIVDGRVISVYRDKVTAPVLLLAFTLLMSLAIIFYQGSLTSNEEYRVSFASYPVYREGTLYCNVVNVSDIDVTVSFTDGVSFSITSLLYPGETIPYIELDFTPTYIVYGGVYKFPLEVKHD